MRTPKSGAVALFVLAGLAMPGSGHAATCYVSVKGNDANDGRTEKTAWRTIAHAAKAAKAGDTVKIKKGKYDGEHVVVANSGTEGSPIVFEGYEGTPVLDGRDGTGRGVLIGGREHIVLRNIKPVRYHCGVRILGSRHILVDKVTCHEMGSGNSGVGISISGRSSHVALSGCETRNCAMHGLNIMARSNHILVEKCTFYITCGERLCSDYGIYTEHAANNTIRNCTIRNLNPRCKGRKHGGGHGIALRHASHHNKVIGCKSYGVLEHFVVGEDGYENEFVNCEAHNMGVLGFSHTDGLVARHGAHDNTFTNCKSIGCTHGIAVWTEVPKTRYVTDNVQRRNVFRNCLIVTKQTKSWHAAVGLKRARQNRIENCTIVVDGKAGRALFYLGNDNVTAGNSLKNCIICGGGKLSFGKGAKPSVTYSCFWANSFDAPPGAGNVTRDPAFADAANGNYHLKSRAGRWDPRSQEWAKDDAHSACVDAGDPEADCSKEPAPNGGRMNMGAYGNTRWASKSASKGEEP